MWQRLAIILNPSTLVNPCRFEAFLGPHPAVGSGIAPTNLFLPSSGGMDGEGSSAAARALQARWLGGACWLEFLAPAALRALPHHYAPLTFVASEGALPEAVPLDAPVAWATMLRRPPDRVLSSYRWWQFMVQRMPQAAGECRLGWQPAAGTTCGVAGSSRHAGVSLAQPLVVVAHSGLLQPSVVPTRHQPTPRWSSGWTLIPTTG
jgi:hypothetical protein